MGCGCSQKPTSNRQAAQKADAQPQAPRRAGGPGDRGYYWEGPRGRKPTPPKT